MDSIDTTLFAKVQPVLAAALKVNPADITPALQFGDLPQWDSMGHMEVMVGLEAALGVEITAETITALTSVEAICTHLAQNGHA
ncbi:MAG: acyl carrier protein [Chloroflexi bacterium]|nr:acyl carrier protein [Chloroflexota bacterium]